MAHGLVQAFDGVVRRIGRGKASYRSPPTWEASGEGRERAAISTPGSR
ncbi:hypothetical protein LUR56_00040 [Streptomyces sp. MT29]|nr:hypothetical protein [Streptomyces sp. MT29]